MGYAVQDLVGEKDGQGEHRSSWFLVEKTANLPASKF